MPSTFQFQPYQSDAPRTIADLMLRAGNAQAEGIRSSGQITAQAIAGIGSGVAQSLAQHQQEQKDAPLRALRLQEAQQNVQEGDLKLQAGRRAQMGQQVLALAVKEFGDNPDKVVKFVTANGFGDLANGYMQTADLWQKLKKGAIDSADSANAFEGEVLSRIAKLPTPEAKQAAWTAAQGGLKAHNVDTSALSPTWDDDAAAAQIAVYGPKPNLMTVNAGDQVVDKNDPSVPILTVPPKAQAPPNTGSFEDYVVRRFGQNPTPTQITQARKDYNQADDKATGFAAADVTKLTPAAIEIAARNYLATGSMPALGMGDKVTRQTILNRAGELDPTANVAANKATFKADQDSLVALQKQRDAIGAFESTALKNLDVFLEAAKKIPDTGSPFFNSPIRAVSERGLGSAEMTAVNTARRTVIPEFAKILSNPGLSGQLSDSARHEVEEVVSGNATLKQMVAASNILKRDAANRRTSYDDQIKTIQGRMRPAAAGGKVTVTDPTGEPHQFDTQAQADAFKRLAGIP